MTSPSNPTGESNESLNPIIAELLTDPQVAQCLLGVFYGIPELDYPGNGHQMSGLKSEDPANITPGVRHYIEYEGIPYVLDKDGIIDRKNGAEFEGFLVSWGDGEKKVFTLTYNDRKGDRRPYSHTDYHIVMPPETHAKVEPILKASPQVIVSLFHKVYPAADRSEGVLAVKDYVELGDVARPKAEKTVAAIAEPRPQRVRASSLLGRLGIRR